MGSGGGAQATLSVESDPPGADARTSTGASCKTPCSLAIQASGDITLNVSLNGYLPQSVPVRLVPPEDPRFVTEGTASGAHFDPNPVLVSLEKAPPPAPPPKKRPAKKRTTAAKPAAPAAAAPAAAAPAAAPASQPAPGAAPWPMPR